MSILRIAAIGAAACVLAGAAAAQTPIQWNSGTGANGHYYRYVDDQVTAEAAFAAAAATNYLGMAGYLVTITSDAENTFVSDTVAGGALSWLGGSDKDAAVNAWTWRVGPEAGQAFSFTKWAGGEPNNCCGGEDYVHTNWASGGYWNDHGSPANAGQLNGYVIEYSAAPVPEPQTYALLLAGLSTLGMVAWRRRFAVMRPAPLQTR